MGFSVILYCYFIFNHNVVNFIYLIVLYIYCCNFIYSMVFQTFLMTKCNRTIRKNPQYRGLAVWRMLFNEMKCNGSLCELWNVLLGIGINIIDIWRYWDRLNVIMEIPIDTVSWSFPRFKIIRRYRCDKRIPPITTPPPKKKNNNKWKTNKQKNMTTRADLPVSVSPVYITILLIVRRIYGIFLSVYRMGVDKENNRMSTSIPLSNMSMA